MSIPGLKSGASTKLSYPTEVSDRQMTGAQRAAGTAHEKAEPAAEATASQPEKRGLAARVKAAWNRRFPPRTSMVVADFDDQPKRANSFKKIPGLLFTSAQSALFGSPVIERVGGQWQLRGLAATIAKLFRHRAPTAPAYPAQPKEIYQGD